MKNVYDYNDLTIDYDYVANDLFDLLEDASKIEIFINNVTVDEIEVNGRYIYTYPLKVKITETSCKKELLLDVKSMKMCFENVFKHLE